MKQTRSQMMKKDPNTESKRQTKTMATTLQATAHHKPMAIDTHLPQVKNIHGQSNHDI
jgi:hypothetical protein